MTPPLSPKKRLFEQFARVAKSLASANRLELLEARGSLHTPICTTTAFKFDSTADLDLALD